MDINAFLYHYVFYVTRVIDGDSIRGYWDKGGCSYQFVDVRLVGINCPETRTRNLTEKELGLKAKYRLSDLIEECPDHELGKQIFVKTEKDATGKYGRLLATIFLSDSTNANQLLLNEKLAVPYGEDVSILWEG